MMNLDQGAQVPEFLCAACKFRNGKAAKRVKSVNSVIVH